jgi:hypothetical protein
MAPQRHRPQTAATRATPRRCRLTAFAFASPAKCRSCSRYRRKTQARTSTNKDGKTTPSPARTIIPVINVILLTAASPSPLTSSFVSLTRPARRPLTWVAMMIPSPLMAKSTLKVWGVTPKIFGDGARKGDNRSSHRRCMLNWDKI